MVVFFELAAFRGVLCSGKNTIFSVPDNTEVMEIVYFGTVMFSKHESSV